MGGEMINVPSPDVGRTTADFLDDVRNALEFCRALGFERLPLRLQETDPFVRGGDEALKALREEIGDCTRCKLSLKRTNIVFGEGNPDADLMFIGEAPGREEDLQARPFVGDAGVLLTRLIEKMGFKREDVYIANIVKCRPPLNRDPEADEIGSCMGFLERQIEIIQPRAIISLGRISAMALTGDIKLKITAIRGRFREYKGIPLMPTFHPAYLMRNPRDKWLTWKDAQSVLELLEDDAKISGPIIAGNPKVL
jgi:uracil-DNA glycosylase